FAGFEGFGKSRLLAGALALLCACGGSRAPAASPSEPSATLMLRTTGAVEEATLRGDRFFGADFEIARLGPEYRGRAYGSLVDLRWSDGKLEGVSGSDRTELYLDE